MAISFFIVILVMTLSFVLISLLEKTKTENKNTILNIGITVIILAINFIFGKINTSLTDFERH